MWLAGLVTLKSLGRSRQQGEKIGEISEAYRKATFSVQKWAFISSLALELGGDDLDRHGGGRAGAAAL